MSNTFGFRLTSPRPHRFGIAVFTALLLLLVVRPGAAWGQAADQSGSGQSGSGQSGSADDRDKPAQDDKDTKDKDKDASSDAKNDRDSKSDPGEGYARLRVLITAGDSNKPLGNASVYVRYDEAPSGILHKVHRAELNFKSNQDGSVKVPSVPKGKVLVQVIAPGWHTFGQWYDITKDPQIIEVHLEKPPRWY